MLDHQIRIPGTLWVDPLWILWKEAGGPKNMKVNTADVASLTLMQVPRGYQLCVSTRSDVRYKLSGLVYENVSSLAKFFQTYRGIRPEVKQLSISGKNRGIAELDGDRIRPEVKQLSISGKNRGIAELDGDRLSFTVDGKEAFEVPLSDVSTTRLQGKKNVVLEFNVDDRPAVDSLIELQFHVPQSHAAAVDFRDKLSSKPHEPAI